MTNNEINYERLPADMDMDETDINLRSYFSRLSDERLLEYDPAWTDEQVLRWDENFTSDNTLMLICSERDVEVAEYRSVLEQHMGFRGLTPGAVSPKA